MRLIEKQRVSALSRPLLISIFMYNDSMNESRDLYSVAVHCSPPPHISTSWSMSEEEAEEKTID